MSRTSPFDPGLTFRPKMGGRTAAFGERLPSFRSQMARALNRYGGRRARTNRSNQPGREAVREPRAREQRQFRFIVSPEDGDRLDLKEFTREFMQRVEKDTGRSLIWAAVNHHNTDNPDVHIVIRGVDRDGEDVRIDGRYIGQEMRWRAQEVLTRELGPRLEIDLSRERTLDIDRHRLTEIDRMLGEHESDDGIVKLQSLL